MKYNMLYGETFKRLQMNAGILARDFDPATGEVKPEDVIGATSGGVSIADAITTSDLGDDIDNCPKNMKELMQLDSHAITASGTFVTVTPEGIRDLIGAADIDPEDATHIVPRNELKDTDFIKDLWFIGDYGKNNGYLAVHLRDVLNTGGFQIQSTDRAKGQFAFTFTACYSMEDPTRVPYEVYLQVKDEEPETPTVKLNHETLELNLDDKQTESLTATVSGGEATGISWKSDHTETATVDASGETVTVTAAGAGEANITATATVNGQEYTATCKVTVEGA